MKFTFDWLKEHLRTQASHMEIADRLPPLGLEVEEIVDNRKKLENFVVGYVTSAERHPSADRLKICLVDIGSQVLQIVCGAPNARAGIYVAVALEGVIIPATGTPLKRGVIRDVESQGMMCSAQELLLDDNNADSDGIMELHTREVGGDLATAIEMDDVIFDISVTPNRADCFCVRGVARDLAAAGIGELAPLPDLKISHVGNNEVGINIVTDQCRYFSTMALDGISGNTPKYIAKRLRAVGQKLIGLPVDAANYICLDVGVPLHIFDMDKLPRSLTIRDAHAGEKLRTLDGKETTLRDGVVVISSEDEPLSIAGIMGGESSAYSKSTSRILVEGAYFDKVAIAKAGQALRILSDARIRCERGVDPEMIDHAVRYVAHIIAGVCDCKISSVKKQGALPANKFTIDLTFGKFAALTGLDREDFAASASILKTLGITVLSVSDDCIGVETPSWRHDLTIEEDLIEEILRISGFENIKESELESVDSAYHTSVTDKITDALAYSGYDEIKTFPFTDRATASLFADPEKLLALKDSVSDDGSILRPSIAISHLKAVKNAQSKSQKNSKIFEVGRQFSRTGDKVVEDHIAIATISEKLTDRNWRANQTDVSVFDIKEVLEKVLNIAVNEWRLRDDAPDYYHPGRRGSYVFQKDTVIAYFGEIHPAILHELDIAGPVVCFELFLNRLPQTIEYKAKPQLMLSQYQQVTRDFSFIVRQSVRASDIVNTIRRTKINEIVDIGIFDVYESADIGDGKKAVAVEVTMQSDRDTLSADQIANISERIIDAVSKSCGGQLRDK